MARSADIQNDINHLQAQWNGEDRAYQNVDAQIRHLRTQADQHQRRMADIQSQIRGKQTELQIANNNEAKEQRDQQAALRQARAAA